MSSCPSLCPASATCAPLCSDRVGTARTHSIRIVRQHAQREPTELDGRRFASSLQVVQENACVLLEQVVGTRSGLDADPIVAKPHLNGGDELMLRNALAALSRDPRLRPRCGPGSFTLRRRDLALLRRVRLLGRVYGRDTSRLRGNGRLRRGSRCGIGYGRRSSRNGGGNRYRRGRDGLDWWGRRVDRRCCGSWRNRGGRRRDGCWCSSRWHSLRLLRLRLGPCLGLGTGIHFGLGGHGCSLG